MLPTIIILSVIAALMFFSLRRIKRDGSCADCAQKSVCGGSCASCEACKNVKAKT